MAATVTKVATTATAPKHRSRIVIIWVSSGNRHPSASALTWDAD